MRCPVCGSRKVIPSLGRLGRRKIEADVAPIAGAGRGTEMPMFTWRCRVCRTAMHAARPPMWKRRRPLSNWMVRRGASGRAAGV